MKIPIGAAGHASPAAVRLLLFDFAATVHELLRGSPGRGLHFFRAFFDAKSPTKLAMQCYRVLTYDVETAALRRSVGSERAHDHVTAWFDGMEHCSHIGVALRRAGEEMEHCAVMPHSKGVWREGYLRDVALHPVDVAGGVPQSVLRCVDGCLGSRGHARYSSLVKRTARSSHR